MRGSHRIAVLLIAVTGAACGGGIPGPSAHPPVSGPPRTTAPSPASRQAGPATTTSTPCTDLRRWTNDQLVRRLIVVPSLDFNLSQLSKVVASGVGGVLFLGSGPAPGNLGALVSRADTESPAGIGLLVMADEEGGGIQRLSPAVEDIPWPRDMTTSLTAGQVTSLATGVGSEMRAAGVNVDLAPVLDVDGGPGPSPSDPDGRRSFSGTVAVAATYGQAFAAGLQRAGVIPVVKHFPGLGGSSGNTDAGPASTRPIASLRANGLQPFRAAIAAGVPAVMVANASVPGLTTQPASLSSEVIAGMLRDELGFKGLVMTDSLSAGAITSAGYTVPRAAVAAVEAGADLVLFGSTLTPADVSQMRPSAVAATTDAISRALTTAMATGRLPISRLREAAGRVLKLRGTAVC